jgi:hypothetical protein
LVASRFYIVTRRFLGDLSPHPYFHAKEFAHALTELSDRSFDGTQSGHIGAHIQLPIGVAHRFEAQQLFGYGAVTHTPHDHTPVAADR